MYNLDMVVSPSSDRLPSWRQCTAFCQQDSIANAHIGMPSMRASLLSSDNNLAVTTGKAKKVLIYDYIGGESVYEFRREISLPDVCYGMLWATGKLLVAAMRKDIIIIDSDSGKYSQLMFPGNNGEGVGSEPQSLSISAAAAATAKKLLGDKNALLSSSMTFLDSTLIVVRDSHAFKLPLSNEVIMGDNGKAMPSQYTTALMNVAYGKPIVLDAAEINWSAPPLVVCANFPYIVALLPKALEVHHIGTQQLVQSLIVQEKTPFTVVAASADGKRCALACSSSGLHTGSPACVYELRMQSLEKQIRELLEVHKFDDALQLFQMMNREKRGTKEYDKQLSDIHKDAAEILLHGLKFSEAFDHYTLAGADPREPLKWFPDLYPSSSQGQSGQDVESLIRGVFGNSQSVEKHMATAKQCLLDYLLSSQRMLAQQNATFGIADPSVLIELNTVIVKLLSEVRPSDVEDFVRNNSSAMSEAEIESFLKSKHMWNSLAVFYDSLSRQRDALDVWRRLGLGELSDPPHNGVNETISMLSRGTVDMSLVWEYADWLLKKHASSALRIFFSEKHEWNLDEVIQYLEARDPLSARKFLENHVFNKTTSDPKHYTHLTQMFIDDLVRTIRKCQADSSRPAPPPEQLTMSAVKRRESTVAGMIMMSRGPEYLDSHNKLMNLLQKCDGPMTEGAEAVLNTIAEAGLQDIDLFDEQIAAYSRLGRHREVFRIIIDRLKDDARAETYCFEGRSPDQTAELLVYLLELYLEVDGPLKPQEKPNDPRELTPRANRLLYKYGRDIDPVKAISVLPGEVALSSVLRFMEKAFQSTLHNKRDTQMVRALLRVQQFRARCEVAELQYPGFLVDEHTLCDECGKELTNKIFVKMPYPSSRLVCYRCWTKRQNTTEVASLPPTAHGNSVYQSSGGVSSPTGTSSSNGTTAKILF